MLSDDGRKDAGKRRPLLLLKQKAVSWNYENVEA